VRAALRRYTPGYCSSSASGAQKNKKYAALGEGAGALRQLHIYWIAAAS
jgi:hypothetical protein